MSARTSSPPHRRGARTVTILVLGACLTYCATVVAGPLKGRIAGQEKLLPDVYVEANRPDAHRFNWREPSATVRAEFRNPTGNPSRDLCIAAMSSNGPPAAAHEPILIKVAGGHTVPTTIVISPGTRLSFENRDPYPHRLYIVGNAAWKAETMETTRRREWTAPSGAARYEIRDELFPSVRSFVVVDPQVVDIAFPGRDGAFGMTLPAGDFVLKAYFGGKQVGRSVSIVSKERGVIDLKDPLNVGEAPDGKP
jgi:hypothetical protein